MLAFVKKYWYVFAIALVVGLIIAHKNCDGCQKRFAKIKESINPLNAATLE